MNPCRSTFVLGVLLTMILSAGCSGGAPPRSTAQTPAGTSGASTAASNPSGPSGPGTGAPTSGSAGGDACALLTPEQVEEFTGFPLESQEPQGTEGCRWLLETGSPVSGSHVISIEVTRSGGRVEFDRMSALEPVPGIGDGAVKLGGNTDGTVWAVRGDSLVRLQYALPVTTTDADPIVLPLLELAVDAL